VGDAGPGVGSGALTKVRNVLLSDCAASTAGFLLSAGGELLFFSGLGGVETLGRIASAAGGESVLTGMVPQLARLAGRLQGLAITSGGSAAFIAAKSYRKNEAGDPSSASLSGWDVVPAIGT
jgi:hypothetical protein